MERKYFVEVEHLITELYTKGERTVYVLNELGLKRCKADNKVKIIGIEVFC